MLARYCYSVITGKTWPCYSHGCAILEKIASKLALNRAPTADAWQQLQRQCTATQVCETLAFHLYALPQLAFSNLEHDLNTDKDACTSSPKENDSLSALSVPKQPTFKDLCEARRTLV